MATAAEVKVPAWCFGPMGLSHLWGRYQPREVQASHFETKRSFQTAAFRKLYAATGERRSRS